MNTKTKKTNQFKQVIQSLYFVIFLFSMHACKDVEAPKLNIVSQISDITEITRNSAFSGGVVISDKPIIASGLCWSTNSNPTIKDSITIIRNGNENFTSKMTNLLPATKYYVRAYATNEVGTGYSDTISFRTLGGIWGANTTDLDGNIYHTITIGTQTWMVENLKTTRYCNGDLIGTTSTPSFDISNEATPKYQWAYDGDENNVANYGRLYTWYTITDSRNIAPTGWHVATNEEWTTLQNYLKENGYSYKFEKWDECIGKSLASKDLWRKTEYTGCVGNDLTTNNNSDFNAVPSGLRNPGGTFVSLGSSALWWVTTEYQSYAYVPSLVFNDNRFCISYGTKNCGLPVRCVKDK